MTQQELAERSGMYQTSISRMESDTYRGHSMPTLLKLAEALGMELEVHFKKPS
jgi:transcriptional regulator with XRE-family HTH domain